MIHRDNVYTLNKHGCNSREAKLSIIGSNRLSIWPTNTVQIDRHYKKQPKLLAIKKDKH